MSTNAQKPGVTVQENPIHDETMQEKWGISSTPQFITGPKLWDPTNYATQNKIHQRKNHGGKLPDIDLLGLGRTVKKCWLTRDDLTPEEPFVPSGKPAWFKILRPILCAR